MQRLLAEFGATALNHAEVPALLSISAFSLWRHMSAQ